MISRLDADFRRGFARLPTPIQQRARKAYRLFQTDAAHPSLNFKPVHPMLPYWSVRVSGGYRAVGIRPSGDRIIWFFIGSHSQYDRLVKTL